MATDDLDDGWDDENYDTDFVNAYDQLDLELLRPLDKKLEKADISEFRPKYKHQKEHQDNLDSIECEDGTTLLLRPPCYDSDDDEHDFEKQRTFFRPPLQVQRNDFVRDNLLAFRDETYELKKICIMGCGEMSLERALMGSFGQMGAKMVLSVDFDEESLSVGQQFVEQKLEQMQEQLSTERGFPILMKTYLGDILEIDNRFSNADAIVSLEVIEHIPLDDAKKFVNLVLGILEPRIFIFSTPNHDYNQAFGGEDPHAFRHDDHKFEMTAEEFSEYLKELRRIHPGYDIFDAVYIGKTEGFEHLKGATQAAVCKLRQNLIANVEVERMPYQMVGQYCLPIGIKPVINRLLKRAFLEWLDAAEFRPTELHDSKFAKYWSVDVKKVLHHIHAPISFASKIDEVEALKFIKNMTKARIHMDCSAGNCMIVTEYVTKEMIRNEIKK